MKILALEAENVKRLRAVEIKPNGNLVEITGKNAQGKTSILDAIWWALAGASNVQAAPIRKGTNEARIKLDLGEIKVTRTFKRGEGTKAATSITVESADGARFPSPQRMLDALLGELSFDPLAFTRMPPKEQFDVLRRFVPGVDFDAIDNAQRGDFERRTDINRRAREARAAAESIALPADCPTEWRDEAALVAKLEEAGQQNADLEKRKANRQSAAEKMAAHTADEARLRGEIDGRVAEIERRRDRRLDKIGEEIKALQAELVTVAEQAVSDITSARETLSSQADGHAAAAAELSKKLEEAPALPEPIDTAALRQQIASARDHNQLVDKHQARAHHIEKATDLEADADALTGAMKARDADKRAKIAAAKLPVEGVEFGDGEILMNSVPFDQASDAEQLRASVAIAAAMNPKLKVIRVRDGSLLDEQSMALLAQMADVMDAQVWVETVQSGRAGAIVIEDGTVKAQPVDAAEEPAQAALV